MNRNVFGKLQCTSPVVERPSWTGILRIVLSSVRTVISLRTDGLTVPHDGSERGVAVEAFSARQAAPLSGSVLVSSGRTRFGHGESEAAEVSHRTHVVVWRGADLALGTVVALSTVVVRERQTFRAAVRSWVADDARAGLAVTDRRQIVAGRTGQRSEASNWAVETHGTNSAGFIARWTVVAR